MTERTARVVNLRYPMFVLLGLSVIHDLDHVRQGRALAAAVLAVGIAGFVIVGAALYLIATRSPPAAVVTVAVGFGTAVALVGVHILPTWSVFSDSYPDVGVDGLSWAIVLAQVAAGLVLAAAGLRARAAVPIARPGSVRRAVGGSSSR